MDEIQTAAEVADQIGATNALEVTFLAVLALISFAVGVGRAVRDSDYRNARQLGALGVTTGATGLGLACFIGHFRGGIGDNWLLLLFVAIFSALIGKPIEKMARKRIEKLLGEKDD